MVETPHLASTLLALIVSILGIYGALECSRRAAKQAHLKKYLLEFGSATFICLIAWGMSIIEFFGAFEIPARHLFISGFLSLISGIGLIFIFIQLKTIRWIQVLLGSFGLGVTLIRMNYIGLIMVKTDSHLVYNPFLFGSALFFAMLASAGILLCVSNPKWYAKKRKQLLSAIFIGGSLTCAFYIALASIAFVEFPPITSTPRLSPVTALLVQISALIGLALIAICIQTIIEREEIISRLKENALQLNRSNKELEHFATLVSHDLQEPLRKIRIFSDFIRESAQESLHSDELDHLNRLQLSAKKMQSLIDDLLCLSRIRRRGGVFKKVDWPQLTREVLAELHYVILENKGRVEIGEIPMIEADPNQMHQMLYQLIDNGLKFHREDVDPIVKVSGRLIHSKTCCIQVEDNGVGIEAQYFDRIFDISVRLCSKKPELGATYPGTGLGLSLVKSIVERHNGRIVLESAVGHGSKFSIELPVKQQYLPDAERLQESSDKS